MREVLGGIMRVGSLMLLFAALFCACASPESAHVSKRSSPIIGGTTDSGHAAVVLLYNSQNSSLCSGTIIAPNVVLTAAHCTVTDESCVKSACVALAPSGFQVM